MKTSPYVEIRRKLLLAAERLKANPRAKVRKSFIGSPISKAPGKAEWVPEEHDDDEWQPLPKGAVKLARVFDGADLSWTWRCHDGERISGHISVAPLSELQKGRSEAPMEGHTNWPLISVSYGSASLVNDAIYFFDNNDYIKGENVAVETVLGAMIDGLGIPGWELQFWEHGVEEDDELAGLEEYERRVVEIRAALALPALAL